MSRRRCNPLRFPALCSAGLLLLCLAALPAAAQEECATCHEAPTHQQLQKSVHSIFSCLDCHAGAAQFPHDSPPPADGCAQCHSDAVAAFARGVHSRAAAKASGPQITCASCHGDVHAALSSHDPASPTSHVHVPATCGQCHSVQFVMESSGLRAQPFFSYQESVHGRAVAAGSEKAAVCSDCHRSHDVLNAADPESLIFKFNVPKTCGQCHTEAARQFTESIHGQALARGNWQSPSCTDCHGIHYIKPHIDPKSSVAAQALARTTCGKCHEGVRLEEEFGVAGRRATSYLDSYHGLASRLGSTVVANCASCHGVHNIYPSSDERSTIHPASLVETCGKCHLGASERFVASRIHLDVPLSEDMGSIGKAWVRRIYLVLIVGLIGSMAVHNGILWRRKALARRQQRGPTIVRLSRNQRIQHWTLFASFFTLVLTGFALSYPDSWLAALLGSSEAFRRIAHRVAGVVLLGLALYHLGYSLFTREGKQALRDFLPRWGDVSDISLNLRHHLGRTPEKPRFGRLTYADKAEYWALVWGTLLMGVTGLMMWFPVEVTLLLPRWTVDIAGALHFYEAVLAVLAIVVWHFYFVIFDPDVYPVNWAVFDGKVSAEHYKEHHAEHYQELAAAGLLPEGGEEAAAQAHPGAASPAEQAGNRTGKEKDEESAG
jgi:formate dehydrogenase gamma subunit